MACISAWNILYIKGTEVVVAILEQVLTVLRVIK
jgi:hypothetical protein